MHHDFYLSDDCKLAFVKEWAAEIARLHQIDPICDAYDMGCGTGIYVEALRQQGIDCDGFDNFANIFDEHVRTDPLRIHIYDVSTPLWYHWPARDLVVSLEVGEHLPARHAKVFVQNLCQLSKKWIFLTCSDRPGKYHCNVQPMPYWVNLIEVLGSHKLQGELAEAARERFRAVIPKEELVWLQEGIMIFRRFM